MRRRLQRSDVERAGTQVNVREMKKNLKVRETLERKSRETLGETESVQTRRLSETGKPPAPSQLLISGCDHNLPSWGS